jgi:uncharacterized protein YcbK (DUF882 family)
MNRRFVRRTTAAFALVSLASATAAFARDLYSPPAPARHAPERVVLVATSDSTTPLIVADSLSGKSGKVWMRLLSSSRSTGIAILRRLFGDSAALRPGVYTAADSATRNPFSFFHLVPFTQKERGTLGSYRMGRWPSERRPSRSEAYQTPEGFVEVTKENQETPVSAHFRLRDFLTHDQQPVWPKYLVMSEALIDKLELTISALEQRGIKADRVTVMSGFRTPQYNAKGVGRGRAKDSRHQYGDAADIFVDANGDGRMDDLNRDGRVNSRDARLLAQIVADVEQAHPELAGGIGTYPATRAHGPFVHVDVRGAPARWGLR